MPLTDILKEFFAGRSKKSKSALDQQVELNKRVLKEAHDKLDQVLEELNSREMVVSISVDKPLPTKLNCTCEVQEDAD